MNNKYEFFVSDAADVSIERILREADPLTNAILVYGDQKSAALFIRSKWLQKFSPNDGLRLGGEPLHAETGSALVPVLWNSHGAVEISYPSGYEEHPHLPAEWRCQVFDKSCIEMVRRDLAAAAAFAPKRRVTVKVLL